MTSSEKFDQPATHPEGLLPEVLLNDNLAEGQNQIVNRMLISERNVFCQDDVDIGCTNDLKMKIELTDDTPVPENYVGVPRPLIG